MRRLILIGACIIGCVYDLHGTSRPCGTDPDCSLGEVCGEDHRCVVGDPDGGVAGRGGSSGGGGRAGAGGAGGAGLGGSGGGAGNGGAGAGAGGAGTGGAGASGAGAGGAGTGGAGASGAGAGGAGAGGAGAGPITWGQMLVPASTLTVSCVWMADPTSGFAGTSGGKVLRFAGGAWTVFATMPGNEGVLAMWGFGSDLFVAGQSGTFYRHDGTRFNSYAGSGARSFNGIWGYLSDEVYAVATEQNGTGLYRYDGMTLTRIHGTDGELHSVWGPAPGELFIGGTQGRVLHLSGGTVTAEPIDWPVGMTSNDIALFTFEGVGGAGADVYAVGTRHGIYKREGTMWRRAYTPFLTGELRGVGGATTGEVLAVGSPATGGPIAAFDGQTWTPQNFDDGFDLFGMWVVGPGDYLVAGGVRSGLDGVIFRGRR